MASWAVKRKLTYLSIVFSVLFILIFVPFLVFWYQAPTCSDGKKNGDEMGIDCGGSCTRLCSSQAISPIVLWQRIFKVSNGVYSAVAYIENPNLESSANGAGYIFKFYDEHNSVIGERKGTTFIPKNKRFAVFEGNIISPQKTPKRVTFEFTSQPNWIKDPTDYSLSVQQKVLTGIETSPRLEATIENRSLENLNRISIVAIIYDDRGNAVGVSRTFIDSLAQREKMPIVFTWPEPFDTETTLCTVPLDVILAIDRSGSMDDDGANPPEPLTSVKAAAISFVRQLGAGDQGALVSFATEASNPIDQTLVSYSSLLEKSIETIAIASGDTQHTNIGDGILKAHTELGSSRHNEGSTRVIILLTDGVATVPQDQKNENYPAEFAKTEASFAKQKGIEIFTIGLGNNTDGDFLADIATNPEHYSFATSSAVVESIYADIATKICKRSPVQIEIIPVPLPLGN